MFSIEFELQQLATQSHRLHYIRSDQSDHCSQLDLIIMGQLCTFLSNNTSITNYLNADELRTVNGKVS